MERPVTWSEVRHVLFEALHLATLVADVHYFHRERRKFEAIFSDIMAFGNVLPGRLDKEWPNENEPVSEEFRKPLLKAVSTFHKRLHDGGSHIAPLARLEVRLLQRS